MIVVVDTSVWINHWRDNATTAVLTLRSGVYAGQIVVPDLVLLEAMRGAGSEAQAWQVERALAPYPVVSVLSHELALLGARQYRELRSIGLTPRRTTDMMIATWCVASNAALLQDDRDYALIAPHLGLRLV
jgi:hypothetical protein